VNRSWTDGDVARAVSRILRGGLLLAALITGVGGAVYLLRHGSDRVAYDTFTGEPDELRTISGIVSGASRGSAPALVQVGVLLLILTPITRVAFSLLGFFLERDRRYMAITAVVLTILLLSLFGRV
jgi:uncharacterized membrane protein